MPLPTASEQVLPADLDHAAFNKTDKFAARFIGQSVETIRAYRKRGIGPRYKKILNKSVRYSIASLIEFMASQPTGGGPGEQACPESLQRSTERAR